MDEEETGVIPTSDYGTSAAYDPAAYGDTGGSTGDDAPPSMIPNIREYLAKSGAPDTGTETGGRPPPDFEGDEPPPMLTPEEMFGGTRTASRPGAFGRGLAEGVVPAATGMGAGVLSGAATGAGLGALGANPFTTAAGGVIGGVIGGLLAGYGGTQAQEWLLEKTGMRDDPTSMFSRQQKATDEALFPYSRAAGGIAAALPTLRPGGTLVERGISGLIGGGAEAVSDYAQHGKVDPVKVGMGAAAGAAFPNVNKPFGQALSKVAPRSWQPHMPGYDPASRISDVGEEGHYLPRAPHMEGPTRPQDWGPQQPDTELTRMMASTREQRDAVNKDNDFEIWKYWDDHYNSLRERARAGASGLGDVEINASQGPGPASTPEQVFRNNAEPWTGPGNATSQPPAPRDPTVGNQGRGGMRDAEAGGPEDWAKDNVARPPGEPTQPSQIISRSLIHDDVRAALGGWGEAKTEPGRSPLRQTAELEGAVGKAILPPEPQPTPPVASGPEPPPGPPPAPATPAPRPQQTLAPRPGQPRIAAPWVREQPPAAAPAAPPATGTVTPPAPAGPVQIGRGAPHATPPAAELGASTPAPAPVSVAPARPAPAPAPAMPAATRAAVQAGPARRARAAPVPKPIAADAPLPPKLAGMTEPLATTARAEFAQRQAEPSKAGQNDPQGWLDFYDRHPMTLIADAKRQGTSAIKIRERLRAQIKENAEKATAPAVRTEHAQAAVEGRKPAKPAPVAKTAPVKPRLAAQAPAETKKPPVDTAQAKATRDELVDQLEARRAKDPTLASVPKEQLPSMAQALGIIGRKSTPAALRKQVIARVREEIAIRQSATQRPKTADVVEAKAPEPKKAAASDDPVAALKDSEVIEMAQVEGLDTKGPIDTVRDALRDAWGVTKKFAGDTGGSIAIGRAREGEPLPRFTPQGARNTLRISPDNQELLKEKLLRIPNPNTLADFATAITRGSNKWAINVIDDLVSKTPEIPPERLPVLQKAREILAERGKGEPETKAAEIEIPRTKEQLPTERVKIEPPAGELPALPTETIMVQKDSRGRVIRSELFDETKAAKMYRWEKELPDYPVLLQEGTEGIPVAGSATRPSEPRYDTPPEPKAAPAPPVEPPAPGKREPQLITTDTGEVRPSKIWEDPRPEPEVTEAVTPAAAPEPVSGPVEIGKGARKGRSDEAKVKQALDALPEDARKDLLDQVARLPEDQRAPAVEKLLQGLRDIKRRGKLELSYGSTARDDADFAHKQGIVDLKEEIVSRHPAAEGETAGQTRSRANQIVKEVNQALQDHAVQLRKDFPDSKREFNKDFVPNKNEPPGSMMVRNAFSLTAGEISPKTFLEREITIGGTAEGAALERSKARIESDIKLQKRLSDRDFDAKVEQDRALTGETARREPYEAVVKPNDNRFNSDSETLVNYLNDMLVNDTRAHDLLHETWKGSPLAEEVATTKDPLQLWVDLMVHHAEVRAEAHQMRLQLPETKVGEQAIRDRLGLQKIENRGKGFFDPTEPGAKAGEGRKLETPEFEPAAAEVKIPPAAKPFPKPGTKEYDEAIAYEKALSKQREAADAARVAWVTQLAEDTKFHERHPEVRGGKAAPKDTKGKYFEGQLAAALGKATKAVKDVLADESGALDVTRLFKFIDKVEKKFRPDRDPMVPTGYTRLYKVEPDGKWAAPTRAEIANDTGTPPTKYADVPTGVIEQYRVEGKPGVTGKAAERFARKWEKEMHLPPDGTDKRVPVTPEHMSFMDHARKLWADESGALDIDMLPNWVKNTVRNGFNPFNNHVDPAINKYADQIAQGMTVEHRTEMASDKRKLFEYIRAATFPDGKVPTVDEFDTIGRAFENRAIDKLPPRLRDYWKAHGENLVKMHDELYDATREYSIKNKLPGHEKLLERADNGNGFASFLPRRAKGKFDEETGFDAIANSMRNSLSTWKTATQERDWFALQYPDGKREIYHVNEAGNVVQWQDHVARGRVTAIPDEFNPRQVGAELPDGAKVDNARTTEIMRHGMIEDAKGNFVKPDLERNPLFVLADGIQDLIYTKGRAKYLDRLINDPTFQGYTAPTEAKAKERWGEGVAQTILPQLRGSGHQEKWFPEQVAWALDDIVKQGFDYKGNRAMEWLARFNQSALKPFYFIGPEVHVMNEADKLIIGRGFDNLNVAKTMRNFSSGLREVRTQGPMTKLYMEAGGNPMFIHALTSRLMPNIARHLNVEIAERPWKNDPIRKYFGFDIKPHWEKVYQDSNKMMWWQSDVLGQMLFHDNLDRHGGGYKNWSSKFAELDKLQKIEKPTAAQAAKIQELSAWRMDLARKAVHEAEKIVDSYVVPTTFGKSVGLEGTGLGRAIQKFMTDPATANFGRFSYGLINTLFNIGRNMAGQNQNMTAPASMVLGFSQAAMLAAMANVIYPLLSKGYQQMPWAKPESEVEARGITSVAKIVPEFAHKGLRDGWGKLARRVWSPAVGPNIALTAYENRDNVGRPILDSSAGWLNVPGQALEHGLSQVVSPAGQLSRAYSAEGFPFASMRFLESNFGLKTPSQAQVKYEAGREQEAMRRAKSRGKHERGVIESLGNKAAAAIRGYEEGGLVTAAETAGGVIPMTGG